ncbi:aa3-type cytochrome c oxidase subunit IV [Methylobrevis albus]|uniref:Aa3-type cytochrome c oxidase subunit IV n=1 Tax=Methylobrevis albus TaxID=2793297 RepID=A0A931I383_9HYPH|nr:aa3-type cytochrome c oxidase subunit IV [Methylobrevis albus]MBH0239430.1 aa3-type cytochrome c oxidase subunit IV [Methylobrevis albus]
MAEHGNSHGNAMDYAEHEKTYNLFIGMVKWGTISVVAIVVLMAIFLV